MSSVTSESVETPDQSAHNAAMIAAAEAGGVQFVNGKPQPNSNGEFPEPPAAEAPAAPAADGRPANVPEKFWNAETKSVNTEALLASYATLEAARGEPAAEAPAEPAAAEAPAEAAEGDDEATPAQEHAVAKAQAEFEASGELSDESYAALEAEGIDRDTVDAYVRGVEATRELAFTAAGGEEKYGEMLEWATKNLTPAEIEAYDTAVSGRPKEVVEAIQGLSTRYNAERRSEPALVDGNAPATPGVDGFKSKAEMTAAMSDPRYKSDEAYRNVVMEKMRNSLAVGINLTV